MVRLVVGTQRALDPLGWEPAAHGCRQRRPTAVNRVRMVA
jgi:hypothetical protein